MHDELKYDECSQCGCLTMEVFYCEDCKEPLCEDCVGDTGLPGVSIHCEDCRGKISETDEN